MTIPADESIRSLNPLIIASFFNGFVFWSSFCYLLRSPCTRFAIRHLSRKFFNRFQLLRSLESEDLEKRLLWNQMAKRRISSDTIFGRHESPVLVFVITLLFFISSLSQFLASLPFQTANNRQMSDDQETCAFLIAWDATFFQTARLLGLVIIGLNLKDLGVQFTEQVVFWLGLIILTVLVIVSNALGIGIARSLAIYSNNLPVSLCSQKPSAPWSLASSLLAVSLDLYSISRLLFIIAPPSFPMRRILDGLFRDYRVVRAISLLLYDLIILAPRSIITNYIEATIPFSVAALLVLEIFNNFTSSNVLYNYSRPPYAQTSPRTSVMEPRMISIIPHPYSAAALGAKSDRSIGIQTPRVTDITTNMGPEELSDSIDLFTLREIQKKSLPPLPPIPMPDKRERGNLLSSRSKHRPSSQITQVSKRSKRLVRPIIPKAELARQFDFSESTPSDSSLNNLGQRTLPPPPLVGTHRKSDPLLNSSILEQPPPAAMPKELYKRHSGATAVTGITVQTTVSQVASLYYGSDIIRPSPGRIAHDRMRHSDFDGPVQTLPSMPSREQPPLNRDASNSTRCSSWLSDRTIDAHIPVFAGGWPIPPTSVPRTSEEGRKSSPQREDKRPIVPPSKDVHIRQKDSESSSTSNTREQSRALRGPRMQFPPPRSKPRTVNK